MTTKATPNLRYLKIYYTPALIESEQRTRERHVGGHCLVCRVRRICECPAHESTDQRGVRVVGRECMHHQHHVPHRFVVAAVDRLSVWCVVHGWGNSEHGQHQWMDTASVRCQSVRVCMRLPEYRRVTPLWRKSHRRPV